LNRRFTVSTTPAAAGLSDTTFLLLPEIAGWAATAGSESAGANWHRRTKQSGFAELGTKVA
jgi:hypothetical protein